MRGETSVNVGPDLLVPAYFHPLAAPELWTRLAGLGERVRSVVVNVHNGPGAELDPVYLTAVHTLKIHRLRPAGYVDTDYARRDPAVVAAEVASYVRWYGLDAVFFDQVGSGLADLDHYAECVLAARAAGARFVVLNPGTHPHPGYVHLANLVVTFEGSWQDYRGLALPPWVREHPADRFCHLVHSMPSDGFGPALQLAAQRHVRSLFLTDGQGDNPWDRLPEALVQALDTLGRPGDPRRGNPDTVRTAL